MPDETENREVVEDTASAPAEESTSAPVDAAALAEEVKEQLRRVVERPRERHEAQNTTTAVSTPTKHEADAVTVARTPSPEAEQALEDALEAKTQESGSGEDLSRYPSAKEVMEQEESDGAADERE